jgi:hypothetical protein
MDLTEGSERSAKINLMPGKYPKENIQDLGFIPLVFWHPKTVLVIHWRCGPVLGAQGGDLCPLLCSPVCILCSNCGWRFWCGGGVLRDSRGQVTMYYICLGMTDTHLFILYLTALSVTHVFHHTQLYTLCTVCVVVTFIRWTAAEYCLIVRRAVTPRHQVTLHTCVGSAAVRPALTIECRNWVRWRVGIY